MYILQTERDSILKPLQAVTGIVDRKNTLPILANVLIENKNGRASILATDLEIQIHTTWISDTPTEFRLTANAKKLQDILRAMPEGSLIALEHSDNRLTIKSGKSRFDLQTLPAEDFPTVNISEDINVAFQLHQETFKNMLSQVQYSMAVQNIRYYLNGLLLKIENKRLSLVATDGHRLAYTALDLDIEQELPHTEVILPRKTVQELFKLLNQPKENLSIEILTNQVRFQCNDTVVISKVIDGKYPDYNRVIPLDNDKIIELNRLALQNALERSSVLAHEKHRGVRLILKSGLLHIVCNNSEQEEAQEDLEIAYQGETVEMGFNITYLLEVLRNLPSEEIILACQDSNHSTLITVPNNEMLKNFRYVVMPMRI